MPHRKPESSVPVEMKEKQVYPVCNASALDNLVQ